LITGQYTVAGTALESDDVTDRVIFRYETGNDHDFSTVKFR